MADDRLVLLAMVMDQNFKQINDRLVALEKRVKRIESRQDEDRT